MYLKSLRFAILFAGVLCVGCRSVRAPWADEPIGEETNVAFVMRNNLLYIPSVTIDGRPGSFLFGSAEASTVLDPGFARASTHMIQLNERQALRFTAVNADLHAIADGVIGANTWAASAVSIDYRAGLLTLQRAGIHSEGMATYRFAAEPMINVTVDGRQLSAIVDTTSPDTLMLPGANGRHAAHVVIAGSDLGNVDIRTGGTTTPRIGNRLLAKFLVTIDYGKKVVGLWRDPR